MISVAIAVKSDLRESTAMSRLARALGGGGHREAAGAVIRGDFASAKSYLMKEIVSYMCGSH